MKHVFEFCVALLLSIAICLTTARKLLSPTDVMHLSQPDSQDSHGILSQEDTMQLERLRLMEEEIAKEQADIERKRKVRAAKLITTKLSGKLQHKEIYDVVKDGYTAAQRIEYDLQQKDEGNDNGGGVAEANTRDN